MIAQLFLIDGFYNLKKTPISNMFVIFFFKNNCFFFLNNEI